MPQATCPTLRDILNSDNCLENLAGLGVNVYVFDKNDLSAALARTDNTYATPIFKSGKGLYKIEAQEETVQYKGSNLKKRGGFKLELTFKVDKVSKSTALLNRAMNNLEVGFIVEDGEDSLIVYDPIRNGKFEGDGIGSDTGAAAGDERQTTYTYKLEPVLYDRLEVTKPASGGWDSLLASAASVGP